MAQRGRSEGDILVINKLCVATLSYMPWISGFVGLEEEEEEEEGLVGMRDVLLILGYYQIPTWSKPVV